MHFKIQFFLIQRKKRNIRNNFVFMQDNDSKHTAYNMDTAQ